MKVKEFLTGISVFLCLQIVCSDILELGEDEQGTPVWKNGEYRDRNEIPLPSNYDEEKKHKRDAAEDLSATKDVDKQKPEDTKKNLIDRVHFAMPFGVDLPLYHVSKGSGKKGKKSAVPGAARQSRSDRLKLDDMLEYGKLNVQTPDRKSSVSRTWGMTYENVFQEKPKETTGQSRSNLAAGYKIKEEDLEDGMMFRGLGGLKLRDQNHQIIEGKFADEEADEQMDVRSDVSKTPSLWRRGLFHFEHLFNHHYHRPHQHHYKPFGPKGNNQNDHDRGGQRQREQQQPNQLQQQPSIQQQQQQQPINQLQHQPNHR